MIKRLKNLSQQDKASFAYLISNVVSKGIGFLTIPVFTRLLSTAEMGTITVYNSWQSIFYVILTLSLTSGSLNVGLLKYKVDRNRFLSCNAFLIFVSVTSFYFFLYFPLRNKMDSFLELSQQVVLSLFLYSIFNASLECWYSKNRYEYKYKSVTAVSISCALLSTFFSVFCVEYAKQNNLNNLADIKILSQNAVIICFGIFFFFLIIKRGKCLYDKNIYKYSLELSIPLIFHSLAKNVLDISDRLMISRLCGNSEAGIYGTVYTISTISLVVWSAINNALIPVMFEKLEEEDYDSLAPNLKKILLLFSGIAILMTLLGPELISILTTKEYKSALDIIPAVSGGIFFTALYNIYGNVILFKEKSNYLMFATSGAAFLNIVLNYIFIKAFGYTAAAYTTLISFMFLAILQGIMQRLLLKRDIISFKFAFLLSASVVTICLICLKLYNFNLIRIAFMLILFALLFFQKNKISLNYS